MGVGAGTVKRLVPTPRGTAELDLTGTERHAFVTITVFDEHGWATDEDVWASHQGEGLADRLSGLTGLSPSEADAVATDFLETWRQQGGPAQGAVTTHRFVLGLVGVLLSVAGVSGGVAWAVARRSPSARSARHLGGVRSGQRNRRPSSRR